MVFIALARRKVRFDIIYRRHTVLNSEYLLAKLFRIPSVKEVNGIVADETKVTKWGNRISLRIIDKEERFNMPRADKIIVVTSRLKEILQKDYRVLGEKVVVIPYTEKDPDISNVPNSIHYDDFKSSESNLEINF